MKRFVSYLYSVFNNQKIHNAGFARIELRTGRNRVEIHLKENGYSGKTGTVYLFIKKEKNIHGISIGNITFRNNQADFRYEQAEENIGQTPWQIMQMNGILIVIDDRPAFLSQWDEEPVDTSGFVVWKGETIHEEMKTGTKQREAEETEIRTDEGTEREHRQEEDGSKTANEKKDKFVQNDTRRQNNNKPGYNKQNNNKQNNNKQLNHNMAGNKNEPNKNSVPKNKNRPGENQSKTAEAVISDEATEKDAAVSGGTNLAESNDLRKYEQSEHALAEESDQTLNIQTAELQPQRKNTWEQTWRDMLRMYPVIDQFDDQKKVLCIRIEIKDVRMLPEKYWSMINNSFLLHGFFNYRYLAFGKIDKNWFIGVPGIYQKQEHVMASIFGFPDFLPQKQMNERGEQPGYWYRILEG